MHTRILLRMRELIRQRLYVVTLHAEEEMDNDDLTIFDVESGILTGTILERQKDHQTREWKYQVQGKTLAGDDVIIVISKFGLTGKLVILTVYRE